jgi:alpha-glucosidase
MPWTEAPDGGFTTGTPWLPVVEPQRRLAVARQDEDPASNLNFARRLIAWRRTLPQLTQGDIAFADAPQSVLALRRDLEGHPSVLAVFNLTGEPQAFDWPEAAGATAFAGHGLPGESDGARIVLPPYGAWFGSLPEMTTIG